MWRFFCVAERWQLVLDGLPSDSVTGAKYDTLNVAPVTGTVRKRLEDDQVLRRAGVQTCFRQELIKCSALNHTLLEGYRAKRDVDGDAPLRLKQQGPAPASEVGSVGKAPGKHAAKFFDVRRLVTEARQNGEVNVYGESRLAPALQRDAADETEPPPSDLTERLDLTCQEEQIAHLAFWRKSPVVPPARMCFSSELTAPPRRRRSWPRYAQPL